MAGALLIGSVFCRLLWAPITPLLRCPTSFTRLCAHQPTTAATTSTSATKEPPVHSAIRTHRGRRRFSVRVS